MERNSSQTSGLAYQRIRVPRSHGSSLQLPPLSEARHLWNRNLAIQTTSAGQLPELSSWRTQARRELIDAALEYGQSYGVSPPLSAANAGPIVMSGHQPELYHPGVWFKNFALSQLGQQFDAIAINLVVDSDLCRDASILAPSKSPAGWQLKRIPIDRNCQAVPYEERLLQDPDLFESFPERLARNSDLPGQDHILTRLWPEVMVARKQLADSGSVVSLGACLSAGRHRLEHQLGLNTLEVPVRHIATFQSFAKFAWTLFERIDEFQRVYNESVVEYRRVNRIRSSAHPVPELACRNNWRETPFWCWTPENLRRRPLFLKPESSGWTFSDQVGWEMQIKSMDDWASVQQSALSVRPRALTTTLFARLILSDLFLHGVGGAKYDQLTDAIARGFFGIDLPTYQTLSATQWLPFEDPVPDLDAATRIRIQRREMQFHPEQFLTSPNADQEAWMREKRRWIENPKLDLRTREGHQTMERLNADLRQAIPVTEGMLEQQLRVSEQQLRDRRVLASREFSYCLHPMSLIEDLRGLAQQASNGA